MLGFLVFTLMVLAALWLFGHHVVKHRFHHLETCLSDNYRSEFIAPTTANHQPQIIALCVDLMRRQHCTVPFDALSAEERLVVLHVYALDALPGWMSHYGAIWLSPPHRRLIGQLRDIKSSRPEHPKQYFGAIKHQQQLRSAAKG